MLLAPGALLLARLNIDKLWASEFIAVQRDSIPVPLLPVATVRRAYSKQVLEPGLQVRRWTLSLPPPPLALI